jgi:hypothetical protein
MSFPRVAAALPNQPGGGPLVAPAIAARPQGLSRPTVQFPDCSADDWHDAGQGE